MADDLLNLMQQWLKCLEQQQERSHETPFTAWQQGQQEHPEADQLPPPQAELLALLTQQSLEFARFAQQLIDQLEQPGGATELDTLLKLYQEHLRRLTQDWILKHWQLPEQLGALFHTQGFQDDLLLDNPFLRSLKNLLSAPSLPGLQPNLQRMLSTLVERLLEYEQALRDYSACYSEINRRASKDFLAAVEQADPAITSISALHSLWVEVYERCYGAVIATDAYRDAHGRIANAVMALRQSLQQWRDRLLTQFGVPSAVQLEQIHKRLHEQRRQIKTLNRELQELRSLRQEVAQLKQQIASLQIEQSTTDERP